MINFAHSERPLKEFDFERWLRRVADNTEEWLAAVVEQDLQRTQNKPLLDAVSYSLLGGGKRLRPALVIAAASSDIKPRPRKARKVDDDVFFEAMTEVGYALECLHCYSLIHDDLPCMDDASTRRNKPSCHKVHGEAMALLAGDCLQALAFSIAAQSAMPQACEVLAEAAGWYGIVGGQARDIAGSAKSEEEFAKMYAEKTSALFVCATRLGLLCQGGSAHRLDAFASHLGMVFQIANDITGEDSDRAIGKKTIVTEFGGERAVKIARHHQNLAAKELKKHDAMLLEYFLDFVAAPLQ